MLVFLSYAEEDGPVAAEVAGWLRERGDEVYWYQDPRQQGQRFIRRIEDAMSRAHRFLALMSPSFLDSNWCRREADLAIQREADLQAGESDASFITVLEIATTPKGRAGLLRSYGWSAARNAEARRHALGNLMPAFALEGATEAPVQPDLGLGPWSPSFRNRDREIDEVMHGLANVAGKHYWLVIAQPQMGKTWFVNHLATRMLERPAPWTVRTVNIGDEPDDVRRDVWLLIERMFDIRTISRYPTVACRAVAQKILSGGKPYLSILDCAESLGEDLVTSLREALATIYRLVEDGHLDDVWLAVVVASRRNDGWQGVRPSPRFHTMCLTEFTTEVVERSLDDLARQMRRTKTPAEIRQDAEIVLGLSEGLPALLVLCLRWIRAEEWIEIHRLREEPDPLAQPQSVSLFQKLAHPYVDENLFGWESLFPQRCHENQECHRALIQAFRVLAPYRIFTQSHLRHHMASDQRLKDAMRDVGWTAEIMWNYLSGTTLLVLPSKEAWKVTNPAIRRLLYRYFNHTNASRSDAHFQARDFSAIWFEGLPSSDQVVGMVESLWHEAAGLAFSMSPDMEERLCVLARTLTELLAESAALSVSELRQNAVRTLDDDDEFQDLIKSVHGLSGRLHDIIWPGEEV
jgi:hypothetical protein